MLCIQFELEMNSDYCSKSKSTWNNHSAFLVSNNILQIPSSRSNRIMGTSSISPLILNECLISNVEGQEEGTSLHGLKFNPSMQLKPYGSW